MNYKNWLLIAFGFLSTPFMLEFLLEYGVLKNILETSAAERSILYVPLIAGGIVGIFASARSYVRKV